MLDKNTVELLFCYPLQWLQCGDKKSSCHHGMGSFLSIYEYIDFDFTKVPQGNSAKIFQKQYFTILKTTKLLDKWVHIFLWLV